MILKKLLQGAFILLTIKFEKVIINLYNLLINITFNY
jgi:hypothetical protein